MVVGNHCLRINGGNFDPGDEVVDVLSRVVFGKPGMLKQFWL